MKLLSCSIYSIIVIKIIYCSPIENNYQNFKNPKESRIVGGSVAPAGRFTYQVAINNDFGLFCSGALISDTYILATAHCIDGAYSLTAYLGVYNIRNRTDNWIVYVLQQESCRVHPEYDAATKRNDIAIIEIPQPVTFNDAISTIGLPYGNEKNIEYDRKYVTVIGWGYDRTDGDGLTPRLHYAQLKLLPYEVCSHFYKDGVSRTNLCTETGTGQGVCFGDWGAPIVYRRKDGSSSLIGLASFISETGCASGWPSVFTRVDSYLDWIEDVTGLSIN